MSESRERRGKGRVNPNNSGELAEQESAPADTSEEQLITDLAGRYDQLDVLWRLAEDDLKRFRIHTQVVTAPFKSIPLFPDGRVHSDPHEYHFLGFLRYGKSWRICFGISHDAPNGLEEEPNWTPITDCSVDVRIDAISVFQELRNKVVKTAEQSVPKLETALENFRRVLNR